MKAILLLVALTITIGALASATHAQTLPEAHFDAEAALVGLAALGVLWIMGRR